jgi:hypothetical protein
MSVPGPPLEAGLLIFLKLIFDMKFSLLIYMLLMVLLFLKEIIRRQALVSTVVKDEDAVRFVG